MPPPSPDAIVVDPTPLNPSAFPYRVDPFPIASLTDELARLVPLETHDPTTAPSFNPHRYTF